MSTVRECFTLMLSTKWPMSMMERTSNDRVDRTQDGEGRQFTASNCCPTVTLPERIKKTITSSPETRLCSADCDEWPRLTTFVSIIALKFFAETSFPGSV